MVFFDTCIWIELCCAISPASAAQKSQAKRAAALLSDVQSRGETILSCKEQLFEVISVVLNKKMKEYQSSCKKAGTPSVGNLKDFRRLPEFANAQALCKQAVSDICAMAMSVGITPYEVSDVLTHLHLVDINDYLYYQYCIRESVDFYSFDQDFRALDASSYIHII